ncbi:ABC transporter substrate-binding protein [Hahella sp. CCB-MM4]|uniref:substrate-binding periplasmic protein n=1 Tax=Hahella sp. (strain CCB-MM4) TaxID=1926491 RepID=UPI00143E05A0|nr:transporter substrate-binding domain-containing protein [Hahella sp. CCB-MM4]
MLQVPATFGACSKLMRWNDDPPYSFSSPDNPGKVQGISVETAKKVFQQMECELRFIKMPWARGLQELRVGRIDLISGAYKTAEREVYANYSQVGLSSPNILFVRTKDAATLPWTRLEQLSGTKFRLGVQINVSYSSEFDRLKSTPDFFKIMVPQSDREVLWKMLALNRIDGVIADEVTGILEIKQLGLAKEIKASSLVVSQKPAYFAFSKQTTMSEFVAEFDRQLQQLIDDGEYQAIVEHYLK